MGYVSTHHVVITTLPGTTLSTLLCHLVRQLEKNKPDYLAEDINLFLTPDDWSESNSRLDIYDHVHAKTHPLNITTFRFVNDWKAYGSDKLCNLLDLVVDISEAAELNILSYTAVRIGESWDDREADLCWNNPELDAMLKKVNPELNPNSYINYAQEMLLVDVQITVEDNIGSNVTPAPPMFRDKEFYKLNPKLHPPKDTEFFDKLRAYETTMDICGRGWLNGTQFITPTKNHPFVWVKIRSIIMTEGDPVTTVLSLVSDVGHNIDLVLDKENGPKIVGILLDYAEPDSAVYNFLIETQAGFL